MRRLGLILLATLVIYVITGLAMGLIVTQGIFAGISSQPDHTGGFTGSFWGDVQGLLGIMFHGGELPDKPPIVWFFVILAVSFLQACLVFLPLPLAPAAAQVGGRLRPRIFFAALLIPLPFVLVGFCLSDALYFLPGPFKSIEEIALMSSVGCLVAWFISWLVWIPLLLRRSKGEPDAVERAVAKALRGTAVGWALTLPWYLVVRERQTCLCALGTFLGLVFGMIALVLVGGPLLLVFARDRRIRAALRQV
ncbi:MAG: hypothetical protein EBR70_02990 [Verrucomicrobia bacterium]|jgi:hypothetical protein|nr:hypothetical protein [Verrucomicrobiota bacterium]